VQGSICARTARSYALPVLAISTAFAGPLLHLAGQEGGGVHIFGGSSKGKTTILQAAASVWGRGASPGYVRAWRATANGLEGAAASATDTALVLDELGVLEARDAQTAIYGLANGSGKARTARDGSLREPKSWRVLILSTGEVPIETKLAEDRGRKARAGQLVRMLDIPADRCRGFGVFDHGGPSNDAGALAKAFKLSESISDPQAPVFAGNAQPWAYLSAWPRSSSPECERGQFAAGYIAQFGQVSAASGTGVAQRIGVRVRDSSVELSPPDRTVARCSSLSKYRTTYESQQTVNMCIFGAAILLHSFMVSAGLPPYQYVLLPPLRVPADMQR
jgi:Domain of unknown function (DUF927)